LDVEDGFASARNERAIEVEAKKLNFQFDSEREQQDAKMKSAYELAMERLEKTSPSISLTADQKKEIAEIDSTYRAKIAEKEVFLRDQIRKAQNAGKFDEVESLEKQQAAEIRRLQEDCEAKKEKLRASFAN